MLKLVLGFVVGLGTGYLAWGSEKSVVERIQDCTETMKSWIPGPKDGEKTPV